MLKVNPHESFMVHIQGALKSNYTNIQHNSVVILNSPWLLPIYKITHCVPSQMPQNVYNIC